MEKHTLKKLSEYEKAFAEINHNLIYSFLHKNGYSIEEFYNIAVFGYLKAVQVYNTREDLQQKYDFAFISWQYMRREISNHFQLEKSKCRKSDNGIISLDANYASDENLYNKIGGESFEDIVKESLLIDDIMEKLSEVQQKITNMKLDGYSNKEIYFLMEIKPSTYYKELKRIKGIINKVIA